MYNTQLNVGDFVDQFPMSPSELMIRTIHWVCPTCGEVARTARQPRLDCVTCGRSGANFEPQREVSVPSD